MSKPALRLVPSSQPAPKPDPLVEWAERHIHAVGVEALGWDDRRSRAEVVAALRRIAAAVSKKAEQFDRS